MDRCNAFNGAPHHEYYEFKWAGLMITRMRLFILKKKKILELFFNILIAHWFSTNKGFIIIHEILQTFIMWICIKIPTNINSYTYVIIYR